MLELVGAALTVPFAVGLIYSEKQAWSYLIVAGVSVLIGTLLILRKPKNNKLFAKEGFVTVALSWVTMSIVGCIPFMITKEIPSFMTAFFEIVSGFTTTGATNLTEVESLSHASLFWRSETHWLGGVGVIIFILAVVRMTGGYSIQLMRAESPGPSPDKLGPRLKTTALILYAIYTVLTVVEAIALLICKIPVFDAVTTALATAGTGGFGIKADSIGSYSHYLQWVITVFMLLFGVSFNMYYLLLLGKWRPVVASNELRGYLGIALVSFAIIAINIYPLYGSVADCVRLSAFQVSSLVTTTGYATADFNLWPQLSKGVLFLLMFVGGCMGSTSGGFKISRLVVLAQVARNELRRSLNPRAINSVKLNGRALDATAEKGILSYLVLYLAVILSVFLIISFEPFGFETNFTAAVSCVNNIGPGFDLIGPAASYSCYSGFSKLVLSVAMLMGRLEIYPMLLFFNPQIWVKR